MRACGGHLQTTAFGGTHQLTARAAHVRVQLVYVRANFCADFDDGLMHFALDLLAEARRGSFHQLAHVGTQFARRRIDDLEFFFDTNREPVTHERPLPVGDARTSRGYHTPVCANCGGSAKKSKDSTPRAQRTARSMR